MSFTHLKKYELDEEPVPYTLFQIEGGPVLQMLSATERNKKYHNALLKRNAKLARRFRAGTKVTREMLQENREHDKELYASFVVVGWDGVKDDSGTEVAFTPDLCRQFLAALPAWIFDDIRLFAIDPSNFLKDDEPDAGDVDASAGN